MTTTTQMDNAKVGYNITSANHFSRAKNQPILLWNITTHTQNVWNIGHNYLNLTKSQMLFYKHEQHIIPDNCTTRYDKNHHILLWDITTPKMYEKNATISQIWHTAKIYFTCNSSPWYLIIVPNIKEIHPAIMEECLRMDRQDGRTDRRLDWWTGPFPIFPHST